MRALIEILHEGNYSCVVRNKNEIITFSGRGIADLYDMVKNKPEVLKGAFVADKVIGKGAAALMVIGGVRSVYADIISLSALTLLQEANIETDYDRVVPLIKNRNQTDWCPVEKLCYEETSAQTILPLIEGFMSKMK